MTNCGLFACFRWVATNSSEPQNRASPNSVDVGAFSCGCKHPVHFSEKGMPAWRAWSDTFYLFAQTLYFQLVRKVYCKLARGETTERVRGKSGGLYLNISTHILQFKIHILHFSNPQKRAQEGALKVEMRPESCLVALQVHYIHLWHFYTFLPAGDFIFKQLFGLSLFKIALNGILESEGPSFTQEKLTMHLNCFFVCSICAG